MTQFSKLARLVLFTGFITATFGFLGSEQASASHVYPPTNSMPGTIRSTFSQCGHTNQSPCNTAWISAPGSPTTTSVEVDYGQSSISLDWHVFSIVSYPNSAVLEARFLASDASAIDPSGRATGSVSGIVGTQLTLDLRPNYRSVGNWKRSTKRFTFAPSGGFTQSGTYRVTIGTKGQNHFHSGSKPYWCIGAPTGEYTSWNLPPCPRNAPSFPIHVTVKPPPQPTLTYSGDCSNISLSVRTSPSTNRWAARFQLRNSGGVWTDQSGNENLIGTYTGNGSSHSKSIRHLIANSGGDSFQLRVRVHDQTFNTTSYDTVTVPNCRPTVTFTANCTNGVAILRADTKSGGVWVARLFVDGVSTYNNPTSLNNVEPARVPATGSLADNAQRTNMSLSAWDDVRSHTLHYIVYDEGYGNGRQVSATSAVRTVGPCVAPSCANSSIATTGFVADTPFTLTFRLGFNKPRGSRVSSTPFAYEVYYAIDGLSPSTGGPISGGGPSNYTTSFSMDPAPAGSYSGYVAFSGPWSTAANPSQACAIGGEGTCEIGTNPNCPITMSANPYFQAFRGDIIAGTGSPSCNASSPGIAAVLSGGQGSGGQLGVFACGEIQNFLSATLNALSEDALKFANTGSGTPGLFSSLSTQSIPNYFTDVAALPASDQSYSNSSINSSLTLNVNGKLTITNNVIRSGGPYESASAIPKIRFVVTGDLYIYPGVSQMYGEYLVGGNVYTCSDGSIPTRAYIESNCVTAPQLKVFGSIVTNNIFLHRMAGHVRDAGATTDYTNPANTSGEIFIEDPLNWIGGAVPGPLNSTTDQTYTTLPPVL